MPPRGVSTPKSRAAARKNGAAGAEHGKKGGRPASALPQEVLDALGPFPVGKRAGLKQARWYTTLLGLITRLQMEGRRGMDKLAKEARANVGAAARMLPPDIIISAAASLQNDEDDQEQDAGAQVVSRSTPPSKESPDGAKRSRPVRCDPS